MHTDVARRTAQLGRRVGHALCGGGLVPALCHAQLAMADAADTPQEGKLDKKAEKEKKKEEKQREKQMKKESKEAFSQDKKSKDKDDGKAKFANPLDDESPADGGVSYENPLGDAGGGTGLDPDDADAWMFKK